jgi:hypothetical protein
MISRKKKKKKKKKRRRPILVQLGGRKREEEAYMMCVYSEYVGWCGREEDTTMANKIEYNEHHLE